MGRKNKIFALVLIFTMVISSLSLFIAKPVSAQSTPKPSIPEFTVSVTDQSYDVQTTTTTTTSPYDGHISTTTTPGYHEVNGSIELSIKNQPFTPHYGSNGYPIKLYYHVRAMGVDPENWLYSPGDGPDSYFQATNSTYTSVTFGYSGNSFEISGGFIGYRPDGTIDFQVEAFIGYMNVTNINPVDIVVRPDDLRTEFVGQTSGWSITQTATIPNASYTPIIPTPLPTSNPTSTPYIPTTGPSVNGKGSTQVVVVFSFTGLLLLVGIIFIVALAVVVSVILLIRHREITAKTANFGT
jgi:hypothetical protein